MTYIANQEAEHFMSWYHRLQDLGYPFGTFPLSKGLWQSAGETSGKVQGVAGYRKGVFPDVEFRPLGL
jgi:uncharacterized ferritin-like protein (DUF455 family)